INAVTCIPGTTDCVAGDSKGNALYATNASPTAGATWNAWTGPATVESKAIACPTTSLCLFADGGKLYYATSLGGAWTQAYSQILGFNAVFCVSSSFCLSGQNALGRFSYSTNPSSSWTLESQGASGTSIKSVFCLSSSFCAIADNVGSVHVATNTSQIESSA